MNFCIKFSFIFVQLNYACVDFGSDPYLHEKPSHSQRLVPSTRNICPIDTIERLAKCVLDETLTGKRPPD